MTYTFRLSIIAIATLGCFISGCNSHASFENNNTNNGNCGNQEFDTGEECDFDTNGTPIFPDPEDSCQKRGFPFGDLGCTDECRIDISECFNEEGCDPIFDNPCELTTNCYFFPFGNPETACNDPGSNTEGSGCETSFECAPRMTCFENLCRRVCQPGDDCPGDLICQGMADWIDGTLGVCPLQTGECNPVTGGGCEGGTFCYIVTDAFELNCQAPGTQPSGNQCFDTSECEPGHLCTNISSIDFGYASCMPLCDLNHPCNNGSACAFARGFQTGICLPDEACDPLIPDSCASPTRSCFITDDLGHTACLTPSGGGTGSNCNLFMYCNVGFFCDNAGNNTNVCRSVCDTGAPNCTDGSCNGQSWPLENVGICK